MENEAVVPAALGLAKVTVPGPLTFDHVIVVNPGGFGNPSSLAVPDNVALAGSVMLWSGPASTTGERLIGDAPATQLQLEPTIEPLTGLSVESPTTVPMPSFRPQRATRPVPLESSWFTSARISAWMRA